MKKNELLHVHSLLLAVAREFSDRGWLAGEALKPYRALGVTPMSIQAPRDDHEEAVLTLARILGDAVDEGSVLVNDESVESDEEAAERVSRGGGDPDRLDGDPVPAGSSSE
jgi:hypothetical protein